MAEQSSDQVHAMLLAARSLYSGTPTLADNPRVALAQQKAATNAAKAINGGSVNASLQASK